MNRWHGLFFVVLSVPSLISCASHRTTTLTTTTATGSTVAVPTDRSLDVSYASDTVELSFARLGQPFRSMHARVARWDGHTWRYFGTLRTDEADTPGELVVGDPGMIEVLAGANTLPAPDRYRAPSLGAGRYVVCTTLVGAAGDREVSGDLVVP